MLIHARHYASAEPLAVAVEQGRIVSVQTSTEQPRRWIAPAIFDPQINGGLGVSFNAPSLTPEGVNRVVQKCLLHGISAFCPTLITGSFDALQHGFSTLSAAIDADAELARRIPGFHLEGPYLSAEDGPRGAHPREQIRDPDRDEFRRWQDAAGGRIRLVTLAPERAGAIDFIEWLSAAGIVVSLGHTAATDAQIHTAVQAGAKCSTHLGNGAHALMPRHPNYLWTQLAEDGLWASIIPDGHHLPAAVVQSIIRAKGITRTLITSDASSLAGMPAGLYREWGTELEVLANGKVVLAGTPYLAGSGHFTDVCVSNVMRMAGLSLKDAVELASLRPRQLLGLPLPTFDVGHPAELMVFDWEAGGDLHVQTTL